MNKDKPMFYRRIFAYIIDMLIISIISSLIGLVVPTNKTYEKTLEEVTKVTLSYKNEEITQKEYQQKYSDLSYDLNKNSVDSSIIVATITVLYFVLMYKLNDGKTVGKQFMKIKVASANGKEIGINNYLVRCLLIDSVLSNIISITLLIFLTKSKYLLINEKISVIFSIFYVVCVIFILYRNDGRGLHDLATNTKVINVIKNKEIKEENKEKNEIKEAKVIEEKEVKGSGKNERVVRTRNSKKK